MKQLSIKVIYKWFFALLTLVAVITEIVVLVDRGQFNAGNFFSYFTIESNILAVITLAIGGYYAYRKRHDDRFDALRGAVTFYMAVTGVVFAVFLSHLDPRVLTAVPWDNTVLHYIMPIVMVLDWVIDPPKRRPTFRMALLWIIFPAAYLVYSLFRGPIVNWYPYPFLDPAQGGYSKVAIVSLIILVVGLAIAWLLTKLRLKKT